MSTSKSEFLSGIERERRRRNAEEAKSYEVDPYKAYLSDKSIRIGKAAKKRLYGCG